MNKITLVKAARYSSNIDVITGFRDLEHAQQTMLDMVDAETTAIVIALEDDFALDTEENNYYITESRDVSFRTPDQITDDDFFTSFFKLADSNYYAGVALSQLTKINIRELDLRTLEDLYDNEAEFSRTEFEALEETLETLEAMERI